MLGQNLEVQPSSFYSWRVPLTEIGHCAIGHDHVFATQTTYIPGQMRAHDLRVWVRASMTVVFDDDDRRNWSDISPSFFNRKILSVIKLRTHKRH
ncbi:hypothetical protein SAMN05444358_11120 [Ruegeria halocynthiae]|uniref:Uncharacterized protein n=1 Tax=Ruegeria halocynthiae TaxID=985054 RepID=A0A1H3EDX4_9RHOB|nr:hypothetical protein SAMN05444358_11120 [Ruegeria halocynthiae]